MIFSRRHSPIAVWAVDDSSAQVTWGRLPAGPVAVTARASSSSVVEIDHDGGPGSVVIDNLPSGTDVTIEVNHRAGASTGGVTTLAPPPGRELARIATISDLHLGATRWGLLKTMSERGDHEVSHPLRCAHSAISDAVAWGADLLVIKGDTVHHETEANFQELGDLVDRFPRLPMLLIPGNHDVDGNHDRQACGRIIPPSVGRRRLTFTRSVDSIDLPGVRVVVADTAKPGRGTGSTARIASAVFDATTESDRPVFLAIHQQLQPGRLPRHWPPGIAAPESTDFLDRLDQLVNPVLVTSGHTHRNRARHHGSVRITEVASTKDWPGVWAGYKVFEGGIIQTVRRASAPDALEWTEYSRRAVAGVWARWSPGRLDDRCLSHAWVSQPELVG